MIIKKAKAIAIVSIGWFRPVQLHTRAEGMSDRKC